MHFVKNLLLGCTLILLISVAMKAQNTVASPANTVVPRLVNFSGTAINDRGRPVAGTIGVTFSIYNTQQGGVPLWMETQNVQADANGHYSVQLGTTTSEGLPLDLFASGEARWLGVRVNGGEEQPRVLLLSVPYALKAADAQTLGGLPASAFALAAPSGSVTPTPTEPASTPSSGSAANIGGSGTQDYIPLWTDNNGDLGNSILYQLGTGSTAKIGINEKSPLFTLDVNGQELVRGLFEMATTNYASKTKGYNSQPLNFESSAFNAGAGKYTLNHFQWQAEPTGNNTNTPGATLNLLYGTDPNQPAETGLNIASSGQITFAKGQTFPGMGTITGVTAGTDLTGGGSAGNVTLNVDTTKVPQLNAANTFTGNQTVNGNLSATGTVSAASLEIGSNLFGFGSYSNGNAFLGFAGNTTTSGQFNTAIGQFVLGSNTLGTFNTASGSSALAANTTGNDNTAIGALALGANAYGSDTTAVGFLALGNSNVTGPNDAFGSGALNSNIEGIFNAAFGYQALYNNYAGPNSAFGNQAIYSNTSGADNSAFGYQALYSSTISFGSSAFGYQALYNSNGEYTQNDAFGADTLYSDTSGIQNAAFGNSAMYDTTTGNYNTAVGYFALGTNVTGSALTCVGADCDIGGDGLRNATAIGAHAVVGASNALVLGGTGQWGVKVGIGTDKPSNILTVGRGLGHPVSDSWETYSSRRWKTNIQTLPDALSKVEHLRGVSYELKDSGKHEIGVIAEEVGQVVPEIVSYEKNGKDAAGVDYSRLTALLIEAVKQQQREVSSLRRQLQRRAAKEAALESRLERLEHHSDETHLASARLAP